MCVKSSLGDLKSSTNKVGFFFFISFLSFFKLVSLILLPQQIWEEITLCTTVKKDVQHPAANTGLAGPLILTLNNFPTPWMSTAVAGAAILPYAVWASTLTSLHLYSLCRRNTIFSLIFYTVKRNDRLHGDSFQHCSLAVRMLWIYIPTWDSLHWGFQVKQISLIYHVYV